MNRLSTQFGRAPKKLLVVRAEYSLCITGESQALRGGCTAVGQDDCLSGWDFLIWGKSCTGYRHSVLIPRDIIVPCASPIPPYTCLNRYRSATAKTFTQQKGLSL